MTRTRDLQAETNRVEELVSALIPHLLTQRGLHPSLDICATPNDALLEVMTDRLNQQQQFGIVEQCRRSTVGFSMVTQSVETVFVVSVDRFEHAWKGIRGEIFDFASWLATSE